MRNLIRTLLGVVMLGAIVFVPSPAAADHGVGATEQPCATDNAPDCYHEEMPDLAVATPAQPCVVTGGVHAGNAFSHDAHFPEIPLVNDDPSHSHFNFDQAVILCPLLSATPLAVDAEGGNDGHMIDILDPVAPLGGANGDILELDPVTDDSAQHDKNAHHGSVNESAWSHSSTFANVASHAGEPESNTCSNAAPGADTDEDQNKADLTINGNPGWVKYIRVGVVVYAWGCSPQGDGNDVFSTVLAILPNPIPGATGLFPPGPGPTCILEFTNLGFQPCPFILVGAAVRGPGWALDTEPLN